MRLNVWSGRKLYILGRVFSGGKLHKLSTMVKMEYLKYRRKVSFLIIEVESRLDRRVFLIANNTIVE